MEVWFGTIQACEGSGCSCEACTDLSSADDGKALSLTKADLETLSKAASILNRVGNIKSRTARDKHGTFVPNPRKNLRIPPPRY